MKTYIFSLKNYCIYILYIIHGNKNLNKGFMKTITNKKNKLLSFIIKKIE